MAKPKNILWTDPGNWKKVIRDARATVGASINRDRRKAMGWANVAASWWVEYGQTVAKTNRLRSEIRQAMKRLGEQRPAVKTTAWFKAAERIILASPAIVETSRLVNTEGARLEAVARTADTYLRLVQTAATIRQGLTDGTTRTTLDKIKTSERRNPPSVVVPKFPTEINVPDPIKKIVLLIGGLYVLTIIMGAKK